MIVKKRHVPFITFHNIQMLKNKEVAGISHTLNLFAALNRLDNSKKEHTLCGF